MLPRVKVLSVALFLVFVILLLTCAISRTVAFIGLFNEHSGISLSQAEAANAHSSNDTDAQPQLVPKIIHQIFHKWKDSENDTIPADWTAIRQRCIDLNPGWKHVLWTGQISRDFIEKEYPWFLKTYDNYRYPVQRVDALRYFLVRHYGGIYLDLDNGCTSSLEPLLYYPVWVTDSGRGALSNNILAGRPNHPFWSMLTHSLVAYNYNFVFPYVTISYASGQWFMTDIWQKYHAMLPDPEETAPQENRLYRLVLDHRGTATWSFFTEGRGESWKNWDNAMFLWVGDHIVSIIGCCVGVGLAIWGVSRAWRRRSFKGYMRLPGPRMQLPDERETSILFGLSSRHRCYA